MKPTIEQLEKGIQFTHKDRPGVTYRIIDINVKLKDETQTSKPHIIEKERGYTGTYECVIMSKAKGISICFEMMGKRTWIFVGIEELRISNEKETNELPF